MLIGRPQCIPFQLVNIKLMEVTVEIHCKTESEELFHSRTTQTYHCRVGGGGVVSVMDCHSPRRDNAGSNPHATTDFSVSAEWPKTTHMLSRWPSINPDSRRTRPVNQEWVRAAAWTKHNWRHYKQNCLRHDGLGQTTMPLKKAYRRYRPRRRKKKKCEDIFDAIVYCHCLLSLLENKFDVSTHIKSHFL